MTQENLIPAIETLLNVVNQIVQEDKLVEALELMDEKFSNISLDVKNSIIMNKARLKRLENKIIAATISNENADVERASIASNLLRINNNVPSEIHTVQLLGKMKSIYVASEETHLEKIIGPYNNLVKIKWLQQAIECAKSVCQVVRADGVKGTGFVLEGGYLMTNFHILPSEEKIKNAKIVFDYEEDFLGNARSTSEFLLDATNWKGSPIQEMDYAYVKIIDNPSNPIAKWGFLELDTFTEPQNGSPVTIIQHPLGQTKQIALTANSIINVDGRKIFYETDTEKGSSGSPVFNNDWKVIALHHAGKTEDEGGLLINSQTGESRGANEGILIKYIAEKLWPNIPS
ncbi:hypothetical protein B4N84_07590 [Flavobacterium sp. IR1]|nr:hypothetical protein B4N84_07590 [Flavobacterium sp. IR1]